MQKLWAEIEEALPHVTFIGYIVDSTATNRRATITVQEDDPNIVTIPCLAHCYILVIKHTAKHFMWASDVNGAVCTISEKVNSSSKLKHELHSLQEQEGIAMRRILTHTPTRFGSKHLVACSFQKSERAWRKMTATYAWSDALKAKGVGKAFTDAHAFLNSATCDDFECIERVEELMSPVMDAIHQLDADQPMLSMVPGLFNSIAKHSDSFAEEYPDLAIGVVPANKRAADSVDVPITLQESFAKDCGVALRPAFNAAVVIDPLNWTKNSI